VPNSKSIATVSDGSHRDNLQALIGHTPLLAEEDATAYAALRSKFYEAVKPADIIEEIWVSDCVDLTWEALRLRRLRVKFLSAAAHEGLTKVLTPLIPSHPQRYNSVNGWAQRDPEYVDFVNSEMEQAGLDRDAITARTLEVKLEEFEKIERLIAGAESRRNKALQELSRYRDALARRLTDISQEATDAEFKEVAPDKLEAAA